MSDEKWITNLAPETPAADAARRVLSVRLAAVAARIAPAVDRSAEDVEHVHQLRVATRRAAAALRIFAECLPDEPRTLPVVSPNANVLEIATLMARSHSPLVAVVDPVDGMLGAITLDYLLDEVLPT